MSAQHLKYPLEKRILKFPYALFLNAAQTDAERYLATYLALKFVCHTGKISIKDMNISLVEPMLHYDEQTFKRHIRWLTRKRWLLKNVETNYFLIRSPHQILDVPKKRKYRYVKIDYTAPAKIRGVVGHTLLKKLADHNQWKHRKSAALAVSTHPAFTLSTLPVRFQNSRQTAFPIALRGAMKCLGLTKSKVEELKHAALKEGYINVEPRFFGVDDVYLLNAFYDEKPAYYKIYKGGKVQYAIDLFCFGRLC